MPKNRTWPRVYARQHSAGVGVESVTPRLDFDLNKYRQRAAKQNVTGERATWPLDVILARTFDSLSEAQFMENHLFKVAREKYAEPIEQKHGSTVKAQIDQLENQQRGLSQKLELLNKVPRQQQR